ncbi:MAG: molybdenum cofactor guanylyltransferase [Rhodocyclales bacterium]|nr:molybdenum cofactor guanylyltransferase [Rhodocyclales bacterium]
MRASTPSHDITGLILAGGLGRRMGGVDKGLQMHAGRPLVAHVAERFAPQVGSLLINANRNTESYAALGYPVVADLVEGFAGPLAGIHAGLAACATPLLATAPCDSPHLPPDLVGRLRAALLRANAEIAIAATPSGLHPTFALMRRGVLPSLAAYLAAGHHRMQEWCRSRSHCIVDFADEQAFANINTLDELATLRPTG